MYENVIKYKTSSPLGDLLSMLPSMRQLWRVTGKKAVIYQFLNVVGEGYAGISQPFTNDIGESIMMGEQTFKNLIKLLKDQEYIEDVLEYTGQKFDYDLDEIRLKVFTNQQYGSLHRNLFYVFPEMSCDLSEPWISVPNIVNEYVYDKVIINFTPRFRNAWINHFFLKKHQSKLLFAGLPKERDEFCKQWLLDIPLIQFYSFYELAIAIKSCKFFMSNQTGFFQIAEGLKINRLLETCPNLPHVIPLGKNGYDAYHQQQFEFLFNKLIN